MPIIDTDELESREIRPGWIGRFIHTATMTLAYYSVASGSSIHEHSHPEEGVWNIVDGELELTIDGEMQTVRSGWIGVVPSNVTHSVHAIRDSRVIVVDSPVRFVVGGVDTREEGQP